MPRSLAETCTDVMLQIAQQQAEPLRTEMLQIMLEDGHITSDQFDALVGRKAA